jgi:hypothetical protein
MKKAPAARKKPASARRRFNFKPWMLGVAGAAIAVIAIGVYFANQHWPYRYRNVKPVLENVFASQIDIQEYHRIYFPHPGFVAKGLVLHRKSAGDLPPVGFTRDLIVRGSWIDLLLLRNRIELVDVVGLHVIIPPVGSKANHEDFPAGSAADFAGPETAVGELHLREATLDIQRTNGGVYSFPIHDLIIRNLQKGQTISYKVDMQNAKPAGRIQSTGKFGPLLPGNLGATALSGDFTFTQVKLSDIGGISGELNASDHFEGTLASVEVDATANISDFAVQNGRPTAVASKIHATVNGLNGGVVLNDVETKIGSSTIRTQGSIVGSPKNTTLDIVVENGRVQDLLGPFLHDKPPLKGNVQLRSHVQLLPATHGENFLQRLRADANFNAPAEKLTNQPTEQKLSAFSQRALGSKAEPDPSDGGSDVLSTLGGQVRIDDGILSTQKLTFGIPGATVNFGGTYNFRNTGVHMTGNLIMDTDISHVTTGFKSLLLKPFAPFFKKGKAGAVLPIAITGTSGQYKVSEDIGHRK